MSLLDDWINLSPSMRRLRLGQRDGQRAILALGTDAGVAWLQSRVESPIGPEWGRTLFELRPHWRQLEQWLRLDSIHCLAAMDALKLYARIPEMPDGADAGMIHSAVEGALVAFGNHRLKIAAKEICFAWPMGPRTRHSVEVPEELAKAADILLRGDSRVISAWHESMAMGMEPVEGAERVWDSLLRYCMDRNLVANVTPRTSPHDVAESLQSLPLASMTNLPWETLLNARRETALALEHFGAECIVQGIALVSLDYGADEYALTFLTPDAAATFESLVHTLELDVIDAKVLK